jgi:anti-anti-sigma factor
MLNVYAEEFPNAIIVHMSGMITLEHLKEAEEVWNDQLDKQPDILAFDFKEVTGIDSISMNHIFKLTKMAAEKEVKLILFDVGDELKRVFEIVRLDKVITMMTGKKLFDEYIK